MSVIQNRDIIIIGLQPWYTPIGSNCKNIALEFARHNRVLYVNSPLDRRTLLQHKNDADIAYHLKVAKGETEPLQRINDNFWSFYPPRILESINWLPFTGLFTLMNRLNNRRFAKCILEAAAQLNFRDVILFNDNDIFRGFYMKEMLQPSLYIYYSRDNLVAMEYFKKHGATLEPQLIAKADLAVANSLYLADRLKIYNANSHYIGQGCDLNLFDPDQEHKRPEALQHLTGPVIGYVGALTAMRLDINILLQISQSRPDWNIVLVGPEDAEFERSALHQQSNIHFIGRKPMQELPSYIHYFDVCINPQLLNEVTEGNYPLKVDEYLAMGKPVVATFTKTMTLFEDYVYLADNAAGYVPLIEKALTEDNASLKKQRTAFARSHTWENSVGALYKAIEQSVHHPIQPQPVS